MRRHHLTGHAEPERMSVALRSLELGSERDDGQFEYQAVAQFFDKVNDRLMVFRRGSFTKTIRENVMSGNGRVKINDGHRHGARDTLGTVIEAEERIEGVWYRGLISASEASLFTKMKEGHVDENSIEFFPVTEDVSRVPRSEVPVGAWTWEQNTGEDTVEVRQMLEVAWVGIAVLPFSSQGRRALLETNAAVPFQDLPVAPDSADWNPEAAAVRLSEWAGTIDMPSRDGVPNFARLGRGYLARGPSKDGSPRFLGQIADVVDGKLVVIPQAIAPALESLSEIAEITGPEMVECGRTVGRYAEKQRSRRKIGLAKDVGGGLPSKGADDPAGPATDLGSKPPTDDNRSDYDALGRANKLRAAELAVQLLRIESLAASYQEVPNEPTRPGRESSQPRAAAVSGGPNEAD